MSIFRRGKFYWYEFELRGVRYQRSTRQGDREAAKRIEAKARTRVASGEPIDEPKPELKVAPLKPVAVANLLDALESDFKLRGKWTVRNQSTFRGARNDFGSYGAHELSAEQVDTYIEKRLAEGFRPATVNRTTELVRQAYRLALKRGKLKDIPDIRHLSEKGNERKGYFSAREIEAVVVGMPEDLRDFCRFAFLTGWRKGEIASLHWSDVEDGFVGLRGEHSKNREPRKIAIEGELVGLIERCREARAVKRAGTITLCEYVFHREGRPVQEFRKSWALACVAAGVGKMVCPKCHNEGTARTCKECEVPTEYSGKIFHDLRRSAVRNLVRSGVAQSVAMKISGHKTASMFRRYDIGSEDDLREAMRAVQQYNATELAKTVGK